MAMTAPNTSTTVTAPRTKQDYRAPLAVLTTLFFIWGSLTSLNDVLIPFAQNVFNLNLAQSFLIQTAFFFAYFVFSIPSARIIDWIGYKRAIIVGLSTMVAACLLVYPAAKIPSFPFFLTALLILAAGITVLQVAANPYVAVLGRPETASSRLVLTQAFNSLGTAVFPWVGARLILKESVNAAAQSASQDAVVKLYVYFFAIVLVLLAVLFAVFRLPKMEAAEHRIGQKIGDSVWQHPNLVFGAVGIFVYVGAEVAIGSSISNYLALNNIGHFASNVVDPAARYLAAKAVAARYISVYWLGAMVGRFIGSAVLQKVKTSRVLAFCAILTALLVAVSVATNGPVAMWSILSVGLFNSIMFPCIFTSGIAELGQLTGDGSGILNTAIVGGAAIPWIVGKIADAINHAHYPTMTQGELSWGQGIHYALIVATFCYLYILFYAVSGSRPNSERYAKG
ncbi:Glucose/galactose transporter [Candidatus Sulfotelmatobacter kueseliae]|uniref:Glucose/galactose transporter n=1 Tax=Candidatus Sulfotelmatobacter kueseliae TaxID=2042962 RepID=A0A2U3K665_9BACT|nr:Glucose/galactose transporter [Candidatus Sulfotelmatobacter kueseliae]